MPELPIPSPAGTKTTKRRILESAVRLFSTKWYGSVSVAEICREAGLSNGVFYRYYPNKAELCKSILATTQQEIAEAVEEVSGVTPRERLAQFVRVVMDFSLYHPDLIAVFREGQYRFIEYERSLEDIYQRGLSRVLGTPINAVESVFALGGIRYCAIRRGLHGEPLDPDSVLAIIERGFFPGLGYRAERVFADLLVPVRRNACEGAKDSLLAAGKALFGERGFVETNIHEITDAAGLAVGTFYTYFASKDAFYAEVIRQTGHDMRRFIASNLPADLNRLEREMRGLWLFINYLQVDVSCYHVVRQAEFILPREADAYYAAFGRGYAKRPLSTDGLASGVDERTAVQFLLGVGHYLGIESVLASGTGDIRDKIEAIGRHYAAGFSERLD
ncbi:MAG TPA: TetR/AcrR family transcriptional regulator [Spirochaetia bacterium]